MKLQDNITVRKIAGQYCVIPFGQRIIDSESIVRTNETGGFLLELLLEDCTEDYLLNEMFLRFLPQNDEEKEICRRDLNAFLNEAKAKNLITD